MIALIGLHAIAGAAALIAGGLMLGVRRTPSPVMFMTYLTALCVMVGALLVAVAIDWTSLEIAARIVYSVLVALAGYMIYRALHALRLLRGISERVVPRYIDDVGFTLISLFDGFVIVGAIDLNAPMPVVVGLGIFGVIAGIAGVNIVKKRQYGRAS